MILFDSADEAHYLTDACDLRVGWTLCEVGNYTLKMRTAIMRTVTCESTGNSLLLVKLEIIISFPKHKAQLQREIANKHDNKYIFYNCPCQGFGS